MTSAANYRYPAIQGDDELETEFEEELEAEVEAEAEVEVEAEEELEEELEDEFEFEAEFEGEFEEFGGGLSRALGGYLARGSEAEEEAELEAEMEAEAEAEFEFDFEAEAEAEGETEAEQEWEWELEIEGEEEAEAFVNPVRRIYRDAELMAHLSTRAAQTESEDEAEAFAGALVPIAGRLIPRAGRLLARNAPTLIRGVSRLTRQLRRNPATRRFITALPVILQRTAQSLADQASAGRPITADTVIRTLTTVAARVLGRRGSRRRAVRAVGVFDRRYHNRWRSGPAGRRDGVRPRQRRRAPRAAVRRARRRR